MLHSGTPMNKKGQATVEFAIAALLFLPLLFAIIDLAVMCYVNLTIQRAVREGARYAITGQTGSSGVRRAEMATRIRESSVGLYDRNDFPDKDPTVSVLNPASTQIFSNYTGTPVTDTGTPNQIIIVSLAYRWPLLTPVLSPFFDGGKYTFTAKATMKNEPWGP
jgi:Flp pilus assembly protein TadG